jgi:hypothetical protein
MTKIYWRGVKVRAFWDQVSSDLHLVMESETQWNRKLI